MFFLCCSSFQSWCSLCGQTFLSADFVLPHLSCVCVLVSCNFCKLVILHNQLWSCNTWVHRSLQIEIYCLVGTFLKLKVLADCIKAGLLKKNPGHLLTQLYGYPQTFTHKTEYVVEIEHYSIVFSTA